MSLFTGMGLRREKYLLVDALHKVVFCYVRKAGSTTWRKVILEAIHNTTKTMRLRKFDVWDSTYRSRHGLIPATHYAGNKMLDYNYNHDKLESSGMVKKSEMYKIFL